MQNFNKGKKAEYSDRVKYVIDEPASEEVTKEA
ncbi:MAG: anaerobic ribonucleoside-triphosphate reductase [Bacillus subtilis]|nr:anaerobic ribonucleoside-triphosphate reductase [Bacillus subtilis]